MRNERTRIITFYEKHLNKTVRCSLDKGVISVYDITLNSLSAASKQNYMKYINVGYSMVFNHDNKNKILIYNS